MKRLLLHTALCALLLALCSACMREELRPGSNPSSQGEGASLSEPEQLSSTVSPREEMARVSAESAQGEDFLSTESEEEWQVVWEMDFESSSQEPSASVEPSATEAVSSAPEQRSGSVAQSSSQSQEPQSQLEEDTPSSQPPQAAAQPETYSAAKDTRGQSTPGLLAEEIELELYRLINREREQNGLSALGMEDTMRWAARIRAPEVMGSLSHTRPDGGAYYTAFDEAGFVYAGKWHGENVSSMSFTAGTYDSLSAARRMFEALKNSPGHYANMLGENFVQTGIGAYVAEDGSMVHVSSAQLFSSL